MQKPLFSFFKLQYFLIPYVVLGIICYLSAFISPTDFWPVIFLNYGILPVTASSIFLVVLLIVLKRKEWVYPFMLSICSTPFLYNTYIFNFPDNETDNLHNIRLLSYNAKLFRLEKTYAKFSLETIEWAVNDSSDIKCFQEFSTNARWKVLDVKGQMEEKGYHSFQFVSDVWLALHSPGLAIFTKYPLLDSGFVWKQTNSVNAGIFADLLVGEDTLRIYNVHLESMYLRLSEIQNSEHIFGKVKEAITNIKYSAIRRNEQIDQLLIHASQSPYPFIICGDFNEVPYSYNYRKLADNYPNSFETVGRGWGFSFRKRFLKLRIDHQFYSDKVKPIDYHTLSYPISSDHLPIVANYHLKH